jgi:tetratricopeptide (TPR) repeat protein
VDSQNNIEHGECLSDETITGYLEGGLAPVVKAACEIHLISCDRCRENLANFMRLFKSDVSSEEETTLASVAAEWDRRNLPSVPKSRKFRFGRSVYYALAGIVAVLAVVFLFLQPSLRQRPSADEIVQALLQKSRPFDPQMSRQPYLALNITRGPEAQPQYALLAEEMTERSADAYRWGRFYLIQKDYDTAVRYLEEAASDDQSSPEVHNDLGVAYLQRNRDGDVEHAREEFQRALVKNDRFEPSTFNLSLWYERNGSRSEAEQMWKRYLELDSTSARAQEVNRKLSVKEFATP